MGLRHPVRLLFQKRLVPKTIVFRTTYVDRKRWRLNKSRRKDSCPSCFGNSLKRDWSLEDSFLKRDWSPVPVIRAGDQTLDILMP